MQIKLSEASSFLAASKRQRPKQTLTVYPPHSSPESQAQKQGSSCSHIAPSNSPKVLLAERTPASCQSSPGVCYTAQSHIPPTWLMSSPDALLLCSIVYQHLLVLAMACCNKFILFARRNGLNRRERKSQSQHFSPLNRQSKITEARGAHDTGALNPRGLGDSLFCTPYLPLSHKISA